MSSIIGDTCSEHFSWSTDTCRKSLLILQSQRMVTFRKTSLILYSCCAAVCAVLVGITIGYYGTMLVQNDAATTEKMINPIKSRLQGMLDITNIAEYLKVLTKHPHVAGSHQDEEVLVDYVLNSFKQSLQHAEVVEYDVMLTYPNTSDPNYLALLASATSSDVIMQTKWKEPPLTPDELDPAIIDGFNSYAPAGHVRGSLVYVKYGKVEDFELLAKLGINLTASVCMARYGGIFRGDKATNAEHFGCQGLVIFSDPMNYAGAGQHTWTPERSQANATYPNTWWLPQTGFQRGSLHMGGDPETMMYPSLNITYRDIPMHLPKIPIQPISYEDAYSFMAVLGGSAAPQAWQGGFKLTYRLGGTFQEPYTNSVVELHVGNYAERRTIRNVMGYIYGVQEPDRYVMMGNHRDAWEHGAADPSSGTAVLLETARAVGEVWRSGEWQPRRTLVFCNWGAEEYGLIGSSEWVEEHEKKLMQRAVAYLNVDIAVQGNATFRASATPTLTQALFAATRAVENPNPAEVEAGRPSVFDTWLHVQPDDNDEEEPFIRNLGSGSDYTMFVQRAGVASIDYRYTFSEHMSSYPVYHSLHDTYRYFVNFLDPGFRYSLAVARVSVELLVDLGARPLLPLRAVTYPRKLKQMLALFRKRHGAALTAANITLDNLDQSIKHFEFVARRFEDGMAAAVASGDELALRRVNDALFYIDRAFLDLTGGLRGGKFRHVVFAPALHDSYSGSGFPGVSDAIFEAQRAAGDDSSRWEKVKKQLSVLALHVLAAADVLQ